MREYNEIKISNPESPKFKLSWLIILTIIIALSGLIIHEYNHAWGSAIVGDSTHSIRFDFEYLFDIIPIPTTGYCGGINMHWFVKLSGGLFTAIMFIGIALWARWTKSLVDYYVEYSFMFVGLCHLFYSFWETIMLWNIDFGIYKMGAYIIYALTFIFYTYIVRHELNAYIRGEKYLQLNSKYCHVW